MCEVCGDESCEEHPLDCPNSYTPPTPQEEQLIKAQTGDTHSLTLSDDIESNLLDARTTRQNDAPSISTADKDKQDEPLNLSALVPLYWLYFTDFANQSVCMLANIIKLLNYYAKPNMPKAYRPILDVIYALLGTCLTVLYLADAHNHKGQMRDMYMATKASENNAKAQKYLETKFPQNAPTHHRSMAPRRRSMAPRRRSMASRRTHETIDQQEQASSWASRSLMLVSLIESTDSFLDITVFLKSFTWDLYFNITTYKTGLNIKDSGPLYVGFVSALGMLSFFLSYQAFYATKAQFDRNLLGNKGSDENTIKKYAQYGAFRGCLIFICPIISIRSQVSQIFPPNQSLLKLSLIASAAILALSTFSVLKSREIIFMWNKGILKSPTIPKKVNTTFTPTSCSCCPSSRSSAAARPTIFIGNRRPDPNPTCQPFGNTLKTRLISSDTKSGTQLSATAECVEDTSSRSSTTDTEEGLFQETTGNKLEKTTLISSDTKSGTQLSATAEYVENRSSRSSTTDTEEGLFQETTGNKLDRICAYLCPIACGINASYLFPKIFLLFKSLSKRPHLDENNCNNMTLILWACSAIIVFGLKKHYQEFSKQALINPLTESTRAQLSS